MTERDLNRIVSYYHELEHYINVYTHRFIIPDIREESLLQEKRDSGYYINEWDTFDEDSFYVVIKNCYMFDFVDFKHIKREDLVKFINEEYGDRAFDGFRSE